MRLAYFSAVTALAIFMSALFIQSGESAQAQNDKQGKPNKKADNARPRQEPVVPNDLTADPKEVALFKNIQWQNGPCLATIGSIGQVQVPAGHKFTAKTGCATIMQLTRNLPNPKDMALVAPSTFNPTDLNNKDWFLIFVWDDIGYVKDDEKADLNADGILKSMRDAEPQANQERARLGFPTLSLVGWQQRPFYDPQTNLLSWATRVQSPGLQGAVETINYNSRILGRNGVMSVELVIAPELMDAELPKFKEIVQGYTFQKGQTYAEWRTGDKVAAYGLTALISGGAVAAAAKSGLLGKLGKFIIYIVVAVVAGIGAVFKKIFGRRNSSAV